MSSAQQQHDSYKTLSVQQHHDSYKKSLAKQQQYDSYKTSSVQQHKTSPAQERGMILQNVISTTT